MSKIQRVGEPLRYHQPAVGMKRNFRGVWIPKEIWFLENLNVWQKMLLIEIHFLDNEEGCYASNAYFAKFLGRGEASIKSDIRRLEQLGLIERTEFDGRRRTLRSRLIQRIYGVPDELTREESPGNTPQVKAEDAKPDVTPPIEVTAKVQPADSSSLAGRQLNHGLRKEERKEDKKEEIDSLSSFTSGAGSRESVTSDLSTQKQKHPGPGVSSDNVPPSVPSGFVLPDDENENVPLSLRPDYTPPSVASPIEFKKQKVVYDTKPVSNWSVKDLFEYFRDRFQKIVERSLPPIPGNKRGIIYKCMNVFRENLGLSMEEYKEFIDLVLYIFPRENLSVTITTIHSNPVYEMILQKRAKYEDDLSDAVANKETIDASGEAIVARLIESNPIYKELYGDN
jgi:DNA-binding Lrp family transcriptional regulator